MSDAKPSAVDNGLFVEIQRFLFREAALARPPRLRRLALAHRRMTFNIVSPPPSHATPGRKAVDYAIIDENKTGLKSRIDQISNPRLTRAENPPSMVRRVVSNIEAFHCEKQDEFSVMSYLLAYRSRPSVPEGGFYVVARHDTLRRSGTDWRLARRNVQLDHIMLYDGALSTLL